MTIATGTDRRGSRVRSLNELFETQLCECGHTKMEHTLDWSTDGKQLMGENLCVSGGDGRELFCMCLCSCSGFKPMDWITGMCVIPESIDGP